MTTSSATTTAAAQKILNPLLIRRLYRSILKTSKPFTSDFNHNTTNTPVVPILRTPMVMNCLLHRTGYDDESWMDFLRGLTTTIPTTTITTTTTTTSSTSQQGMMSLLSPEEKERTLFRILLREVLCGGGNGGTLPFHDQNINNDNNNNASSSSSTADPNPDTNATDTTTTQSSSSPSSPSSSSSSGLKIMQFPIHVRSNPNRIYHIIQREFRIPLTHHIMDGTTRQNMAFRCIREMNKKIVFAHQCEQRFCHAKNNNNNNNHHPSSKSTPFNLLKQKLIRTQPTLPILSTPSSIRTTTSTPPEEPNLPHPMANRTTTATTTHANHPFHYQMAKHVHPLPLAPSSTYIRPGLFLLAHPHMTGYFRRSVICILDHRTAGEDNMEDDSDNDDDEEEDDSTIASATSDEDDDDDEDSSSDDEDDSSDDDEYEKETEDTSPPSSQDTSTTTITIDNDDKSNSNVMESTTITSTLLQESREESSDAAPTIPDSTEEKEDDQPTTKITSKSSRTNKKKKKQQQQYGTYGLIVNRLSVSPYTGEALSMNDVLRPLPATIMKTFGKFPIREGGPVHMSVQMLYQINTSMVAPNNNSITPSASSTLSVEESVGETSDTMNPPNIGGYILPTIQPDIDTVGDSDNNNTNEISNTVGSCDTDKAVYYRGNIMNVIKAMDRGMIENGEDDISFFVGASCWSVGQLEREIENGFWLPCIGPTSIAQTGMCEYYNTTATNGTDTTTHSSSVETPQQQQQSSPNSHHPRPEADLWLSMMSACGIEEAKLAHLLYKDDGKDPNGAACDIRQTTTTVSSSK